MRTTTCENFDTKNGIAIQKDLELAKHYGMVIIVLLIFSVLSLLFK